MVKKTIQITPACLNGEKVLRNVVLVKNTNLDESGEISWDNQKSDDFANSKNGEIDQNVRKMDIETAKSDSDTKSIHSNNKSDSLHQTKEVVNSKARPNNLGISPFNFPDDVSRFIDSGEEMTPSDDEDILSSPELEEMEVASSNGDFVEAPNMHPTIAFDWSGLNFDCLDLSTEDLGNLSEEENHENLLDDCEVSSTGTSTRSDQILNILNLRQGGKRLLNPSKSLISNCRRKLSRKGLPFKDRSRSMDLSKIDQTGSTTTLRLYSEESHRERPKSSEDPDCKKESFDEVSNDSFGSRVRIRMNKTVHSSIKRRESIGIITQPMMNVIRGVRGRARSVSKSRGSLSGGSEDSQSVRHSSDYEDEVERGGGADSSSLLGRFRGLRKDMQRKIAKVKSPRNSITSEDDQDNLCATSNVNCNTTSEHVVKNDPNSRPPGSCAPHPPPRSQFPLASSPPYKGPFIGRATALVDFQPSPYDHGLLKLKKGDVIDIISKSPSGLWKGSILGRVGDFKFILVEEDRPLRGNVGAGRRSLAKHSTGTSRQHTSLESLLKQLKLGHLLQTFVLNGYENLNQFKGVEDRDLDELGIRDIETKTKLLDAATSLFHPYDVHPTHTYDSINVQDNVIVGRVSEKGVVNNTASSRDSGCFTDQKHSGFTEGESAGGGRLLQHSSSPSSTENSSSGYQSRDKLLGHYANIPTTNTLQKVPDFDSSPSSSTEGNVSAITGEDSSSVTTLYINEAKDMKKTDCSSPRTSSSSSSKSGFRVHSSVARSTTPG